VAKWSKASVCCRSLASIGSSNPVVGMDLRFLRMLCASAESLYLVQGSPAERVCVFECDKMQQ
jgi:hypothetical protein